ncbi:MAG: Crp/Fnr family transcriptional regulator [Cytophagaceae bacterium]
MTDNKAFVKGFFQPAISNAGTLDMIAQQFHPINIQKNELFLEEGKISNKYLILESGFMRAYSHDTEGNEVTTAFFNAGQPVFEVASFFMRIPSKENIQALSPSAGYIIIFEELNKLFHSIPEFREFGRSILVKGFASLKLRMLSMITETAEFRYAALLQSNPEIFMQAPLKQIASYLGITDSSLSRIRREMTKSQN